MKRLLMLLSLTLACLFVAAKEEIVSFRLSTQNGLPDNNIRSIRQDTLGYLYLQSLYATYRYDGYTFTRLDNNEVEHLQASLPPAPKSVTTGAGIDNCGNRYEVKADGTLLYHDHEGGESISIKVFDPELLLQSNSLKCRVVTDREGRVWVSVNGNGLFVYNRQTGQMRHITDHDQPRLIVNNFIVSMMEDSDGRIWVSQEHYGLACLQVVERDYELVDMNGIDNTHDNIRMMKRTGDDQLLIADNYGSLFRSDGRLQHLAPLTTHQENYLTALTDSQGRLWMGSKLKGVNVDGRWYGSDRVDCILEDYRSRIWLCGIKGDLIQATLRADGDYTERHFLSGVNKLSPHVMVCDRERRHIWLGTLSGLYSFDTDSLLSDTTAYRRLSEVPVLSLLMDSRGRLWAGTRGKGLMTPDGHFITTADGLPNDVVQTIVEDSRGYICIGTEDGCAFYDPEKGLFTGNLFFGDNLARNFYNEQAAVMLNDGRVALGTLAGVVILGRDFKAQTARASQVVLTGLTVGGVPLSVDSLSMNADGQLLFSHDQNSLTFSFSNFAYGQQRLTNYSYRLHDYDDDWSTASHMNFVTYRNLTPGSYTLEVRCLTGTDSQAVTQVCFRIKPPLWQTWWAYLIYIVLTVIAAYTLYRHLRYLLQLRQSIAVEKQLTEYKLKFFTNISHEFRTPLTLIQGSMDKLRQLPETPSSARQPLSSMQRNVDRLLRLINQLLEFRRMQNNKLQLSLEETDIVSFCHNLYQSFHDTAEQQKISFTFLPTMKSFPMYIDRGFIDKAVYNLLSNAFKYTPRQGSVTLRVMPGDEQCLLQVIDSGVGVPEDQREAIFDRFARGQIGRDSLGIGLDLTAELIRTHHGTISCTANEPEGSIFTIALPVSKEVYEEKDFLSLKAPRLDEQSDERQGFTVAVSETLPEPMNDHRVLIVEDDADIRSYLQQELGRYFAIETACDGEEAIEKTGDVQLVITDIMMPRKNGYELLHHIRKNAATRHLPVIMLTALDSDDKVVRGLDAGADAYIAKPFSLQLLLLQCRNLLQRDDSMKDACASVLPNTRHLTPNTQQGLPASQKKSSPQIITEERDRKLLAQLAAWVDSHLASPDLSVDKFAAELGYGCTTFYAKLKALTGQTPNDYIKERRLERAAELLNDDQVTVAEVAYQVGMSTPQYLSTCFKKRYSLTPSQYQKK